MATPFICVQCGVQFAPGSTPPAATVTFGDVPIYLHEADREWVMRPDERIHFWSGDTTKLHESVTLIHCGGHFAGSTARFPVLSFEQTPRRVSDVRSTGIGVRALRTGRHSRSGVDL